MKKLAFIVLSLFLFTGCLYTSTYQKTVIPFLDEKNGIEPWITDLTAKNTKLLKNISAKNKNSYHQPYDKTGAIEMGCFHYFLADGALYKSNGTTIGTKIDDNIEDFQFSKLVKMNNRLFFSLINQPSIFAVHPKEGYSASIIHYFNQSKHKRKVVDFSANAYGDNFIIIVSRELRQDSGYIYELYLGDAKGSKTTFINFELDTKADIDIKKVFVTKNKIYLLGEDGSMWRTKNSKNLPEKVLFLPYEAEKKVNSCSLINDTNNLYFSYDKHIYKSNNTEFAKPINREPIDKYTELYKIFNNHIIYSSITKQTKLCAIDLKTRKSKVLATSKKLLPSCDNPIVKSRQAKSNERFEFLSEKFDKKIFGVVKKALYALESNEIKKFQSTIHPKRGITLSVNTYFNDANLNFSKDNFIDIYKKREQFFWGEDETKGDSINMTLYDYVQGFPKKISRVSKIIKLDNLKNFSNTKEQNIKGYEIYWVGEENPEYNWMGLVVILQKYENSWYMVGMLNDYWTP